MLKNLISRAQAFLIGSVILAAACGVAVIAAAYGLYALLRLDLSAPASAAITAGVFAVIAGIAAVLLLRLFSFRGAQKDAKPAPVRNPQAVQIGMEAGMAVVGMIADMMVSRREKNKSRRGKTR